MSKLSKIIRDKSIESIIEKLLVLLWLLMLPGLLWFRDATLNILQYISKESLLISSLLLFSLLLVSISFILLLRKKIKNPLDSYQFDSMFGYYKNKETGELFCCRCILKNIPAQLKEYDDYWRCKNCGEWYYKLSYKHAMPTN